MSTSIRWEYDQRRLVCLGYITDHVFGYEFRGLYLTKQLFLRETKKHVRKLLKDAIDREVPGDDNHDLFTSSIEQLRVLGFDLTEEFEEESVELALPNWKFKEDVLKKAEAARERILNRFALTRMNINPHMVEYEDEADDLFTEDELDRIADLMELERTSEGTDSADDSYAERCAEDFGINTAEKVDGAKALDILKSMIYPVYGFKERPGVSRIVPRPSSCFLKK